MPLFYLFSLIFTLLPFLVIGFIVLIIFQATSQSRKKVKGTLKPSSLLEKYQADWVKNAQKQERPKANPRRSPQARLDQDPKASRKKRRQKEKQAKRKAKQSSKRQASQQTTEKNRAKQGSKTQNQTKGNRSQAKSDPDWSGEINSSSGNQIYQGEIQSIFDKKQYDHRQNLNQVQNLGQQVAKNLKRDQLKQAMIYKEILDKPKSLSDDL